MTDEPVRTIVLTDEGELPFQEYFVAAGLRARRPWLPLRGAEAARPAPGVLEALAEAAAVILCPSNPWVSLDPILALPGVRQAVARRRAWASRRSSAGRRSKARRPRCSARWGSSRPPVAVAQHYRGLLAGW